MDDIEICPPWWPRMIWWLIHHPPKGPRRPAVAKAVTDATESLLVGLNTYHGALAIGPKQEDLRAQLRRAAIEQMSDAVKQLARPVQG
jgi:hypothetical protein